MSGSWVPVAVGVLCGVAVLLLSRARLAGQETPLATVRHTVYGGGPQRSWEAPAVTPGRAGPWWEPAWLARLTAPVAARAAGSQLGRGWAAQWAADLRAANRTLPGLLGEAFAFGVVVFVAVELMWVALWLTTQLAAGVVVLPALPAAVFGVAGAVVAIWVRVRMLRVDAARRRVEFRQMSCDFISLVACYLTTATTAEVAVDRASRDGGGWAWSELARAVHGARHSGRTTEEALVGLADVYEVRQVRDMGAALARYQARGSITEAMMALAGSMRAEMLDGLEREADRANQKMIGPIYLYVAGVFVLVLLPLFDLLSSSL